MNINLQKDSLLIIHKAEDPGLFAYRLNGPENLETLAEHQLVAKSNEEKRPFQGYLTRVEKWYQKHYLVWGYQQLGQAKQRESYFVIEDVIFD